MDKTFPQPFFRVALIEPEIPQNTGNIGRTCVGTNSELHLVGKLGFQIDDTQLKRAGLDYWPYLKWFQHSDYAAFRSSIPLAGEELFYFSTKAERSIFDVDFKFGDWLIFGCETKGLSDEIRQQEQANLVKIPQYGPVRSLNLATAVAISIYQGISKASRLIRPLS